MTTRRNTMMWKRIVAMVCLITMIITTVPVYATANSSSAATEAPVEQKLTAADVAAQKANMLVKDYGVTSVQYALIDNGEITISDNAGVYSYKGNTKLNKNHIYPIASVSKIYTTTAIMQLVEQGKIDLDEPVVTYVKDFKMKDARYKDITVRMLINHSSGLMGSSASVAGTNLGDRGNKQHEQLLAKLSKERLKAAPGAFSVYCNDGFSLAELVVERVSKLTFTQYLQKNIYKPLGLGNTKTPIESFSESKVPKNYLIGTKTELPTEYLNAIGTGGILASAEDLAKFATTFMKESNGLLTKESTKAMAQPEYKRGMWADAEDSTISYGLGWDSIKSYPFNKYNITALVKGGDLINYHSSLIVLPEYNLAMVVNTSGSSSAMNQVMGQEVLLAVLKEKKIISDIKPERQPSQPIKAMMPTLQKKYSGYYAVGSNVMQVSVNDDGVMSYSLAGMDEEYAMKLYYTIDGVFADDTGLLWFKFVEEKNGKIYLYIQSYTTYPDFGQTAYGGYYGQKLEENQVDASTLAAWKKRSGKIYVSMTANYRSLLFALGAVFMGVDGSQELPTYWDGHAIIDDLNAVSTIEIPVTNGRDTYDFKYYEKNGIEYLDTIGGTYKILSAVKDLSVRKKFNVTLGKSGYNTWYRVPDKKAGKTVKVTIPKNASFAVYNANFEKVTYSIVDKKNTVKFPKGGYIVFSGSANAKFTVEYK